MGGDTFQQAKIDGDMYPTGRDRRRSNRQRQMGACIQQVETDGECTQQAETEGTQPNKHPANVTWTQQVKTGTQGVETDRSPATEAGGRQSEAASVSEARGG